MKISRDTAVQFMLALQFSSAAEWDDEKLINRLGQVPERLTIDAVPDKYHDIYNQLKEGGKVELTSEDEAPAKKGKGKTAAKPAKPAKQAKAEKPAKVKKEKPAKKQVERDAYGSAKGTLRANINATFSTDWKTDAEVSKEAGCTLRQARSRLRRATRSGILIKERIIRYRLAPTKKADKKS